MSNVILTQPTGNLAADIAITTSEPTGFIDRSHSIISFGVAGSGSPESRTFTIEPSGLSGGSPSYYQYYIKGVKYTETAAKSITLPDVNGIYFIYFDDTQTLNTTQDFPTGLLTELAYVAVAYWNNDADEIIYFGEERHGSVMDGATHLHFHTSFGTQYVSGLTLDGTYTPRDDGSPITGSPFTNTDSEVQFSVTGGVIRDEDISLSIVDLGNKNNIHDLEQELSPIAKIPVLYRIGPEGHWYLRRNNSSPADTFPFIWSDGVTFTGANGRPAINVLSGSPTEWQLVEVNNDRFFLAHILATNDINNPIVALTGTTEYETAPAGAEEASVELTSLGGLPFQEFVLLYTLILHTDDLHTNTPKTIGHKTSEGDNLVDWRSRELFSSVTGGSSVSDHGNLAGLDDDDHSQYTLRSYDQVTDGTTNVTASGRGNAIGFDSGSGIELSISSDTGSPPAKATVNIATAGAMELSTINGQPIMTFNDTSRGGKRLSFAEQSLTFSDVVISVNEWINIGNATDADSGYIADLDGTVVFATGHCENTNGNSKDIHLFINDTDQGSVGTLAGASPEESSFTTTTINVDFNQGDKIRLQAQQGSGLNILDTIVKLSIRWRS